VVLDDWANSMNVKIEQVTIADEAKLLEWRNSLEVSKWMFSNHVISEAEHSAWFKQMLLSEKTVYWKIIKDSQAVGIVNLSKIDLTNASCSWAIYLGEASARGFGAAQAASLLSLNFAFDVLRLGVVRCEAIAENVRAIGLYKQVGFVSLPTQAEVVRRGESNLAIVKLELSDDAWKLSKNALQQILNEKGVSLDEQ
jgi:UDP-4-amino-4,6-dideoxy-N-acetyl-beta-L-altrosamine N-acetyltransferase